MSDLPSDVTLIDRGEGVEPFRARFKPLAGAMGGSANFRELKVYEPGIAWTRQEPRWRLIEQLAQGTMGMQAAGTRYLPQEPRESDESYKIRLANSICTPYYLRLEQMLAGMLTRKPVRLDNVPEQMMGHFSNIDMMGHGLDVFLQSIARKGLRYGHVGVLVDFPRGDEGDNSPVTDFRRPYWIPYSPRDILGWKTDVVDGMLKLTELRLYEELVVPYGTYGEEPVAQVRVLTPGAFKLFRLQPSKSRDWEEISEGNTNLNTIPFGIAYTQQVGILESSPPLEEIAWLNLQAYRCESDQSNLLHVAAVPRQFLFGAPGELEEISAGPESATALPVDARVEFSEPIGTSYEARFNQIDRIKAQIAELGMAAVLGQNMTNQAAEAKAIDRSQGDAALQSVAIGLQDLLNTCLQYHAAFLQLPDGGSATVNRDFVSARLDPAEVAQLIQLRINDDISQESLLNRLAEGEWMGGDFDVQMELEKTAQEKAKALADQQAQLDASLSGLPYG